MYCLAARVWIMSATLRVPTEDHKPCPGEALNMRVKTIVLGSASLAMLAFAGSPALAQGGTPQGGDTGNGQPTSGSGDANAASPGQASQASTGPGATAAADAGDDTIVVTGLRRSLQSAQNVKRNSQQIVDAIVAEDIGKLP